MQQGCVCYSYMRPTPRRCVTWQNQPDRSCSITPTTIRMLLPINAVSRFLGNMRLLFTASGRFLRTSKIHVEVEYCQEPQVVSKLIY